MRKFLTTNLERSAEGKWHWQINLPALTSALPALEANPLAATDRFDGPATFIAGGKSTYIESDDHVAIRRHFPGSAIVTLPHAVPQPDMETRASCPAVRNAVE